MVILMTIVWRISDFSILIVTHKQKLIKDVIHVEQEKELVVAERKIFFTSDMHFGHR